MQCENVSRLIRSLLRPGAYPHPVTAPKLLETHISWVLLTGPFAYKIKKPVKLGFLDFSSLELREHFCNEELRLNQRWASELYLGVVGVRGSTSNPVIGGDGPLLDYAIKMVQFPQSARLDAQLDAGLLDGNDMESIADMLASKHANAIKKFPDIQHSVRQPMAENFEPLAIHHDQLIVGRLKSWTIHELDEVQLLLELRRDDGFVRECHGDLHLANLVRLESGIHAFDCIEFSAELRDIDVISDVAFLVMDLVARQRADLAYHFLNRYLEKSGDYAGVKLFDLYFVYHCIIRAKIAAIRGDERSDALSVVHDTDELQHYLDVAADHTLRSRPSLILMHGMSGSGKTWLSEKILGALPAIRVRSDVERKRLFGYEEIERSNSEFGEGIYTDTATDAVYDRLAELAADLLTAGHTAIIDASFLKYAERSAFRNLADQLGVPFILIHTYAPGTTLASRLQRRNESGFDASEADVEVLRHQLKKADPLTPDERCNAIAIDTEGNIDVLSMVSKINQLSNSRQLDENAK